MGSLTLSGAAVTALSGAALAAAFYADDVAGRLSPQRRSALVAGAVAAASVAFVILLRYAIVAARHPGRWDFLAFFMFGHVATSTHDVYDPAGFARLYPALGTPDAFADPGFERIVVEIGMPYPPVTIPLIAWLGAFSNYHAASAAWYALLFAAILGSIVLFRSAFISSRGVLGYALAVTIVSVFHGVFADLRSAQTIPFALLGTLGALAARGREGLWIALAIVGKPLTAALLVVPLLMRRFAVLLQAAGGLALLLALAAAIAGPATVAHYFTGSIYSRFPPGAFMEDINLSLPAAVFRAIYPQPPETFAPGAWLPCELWGAALALPTLALAARACLRGNDDTAFGLTLCAALLLFPQTLPYYTPLVLVPLGIAWKHRAELPGGAVAVALAGGVLAVGLGIDWGLVNFVFVLSLWAGFAAWAFVARAPKAPRARSANARVRPARIVAC